MVAFQKVQMALEWISHDLKRAMKGYIRGQETISHEIRSISLESISHDLEGKIAKSYIGGWVYRISKDRVDCSTILELFWPIIMLISYFNANELFQLRTTCKGLVEIWMHKSHYQ